MAAVETKAPRGILADEVLMVICSAVMISTAAARLIIAVRDIVIAVTAIDPISSNQYVLRGLRESCDKKSRVPEINATIAAKRPFWLAFVVPSKR